MFNKSLIFLLILLLCASGKATEVSAEKKASLTSPKTIPLKRSGNLFFIDCRIDEMEGNLILDTGAEGLVLNETYFREFEWDEDRMVATVNGGSEAAKYTRPGDIDIGGLPFYTGMADVVDLSAIENNRGYKVLGSVGLSFFKDYDLAMDFGEAYMTLYPRDMQHEEPAGTILLDLKYYNGVPSADITINEVELRFILDTGAELNVIHNDLDQQVYEGMEIINTTTLLGADSRRTQVLIAKLKNVKIKRKKIADPLSLVLDMSRTREVTSKKIAGTLGIPFFEQGRVLFLIKDKQMRIELE